MILNAWKEAKVQPTDCDGTLLQRCEVWAKAGRGNAHCLSSGESWGHFPLLFASLSLCPFLSFSLSHPFCLPIFHLFFLPSFLPFYLSSFPFKILLILSLFLIIPLFFSSFSPFSHPTPPINFPFFQILILERQISADL